MKGKSPGVLTILLAVWLSAIAVAPIGALLGLLSVGQLESLPISDNERMTMELNHMGRQLIGLFTGGFLGAVIGGLGALIYLLLYRLMRSSRSKNLAESTEI